MTSQLSSLLFLVVGISMAITPWLAAGGQLIASRFEQQDVRSLLPVESEVIYLEYTNILVAFCSWAYFVYFVVFNFQTDDLQDHIIICGFGRVGQV